MFWRLVLQLLRRSRGRLTVAALAIVSGAAVMSALLNLDLGVQNKLTQEFRALGANIVIAPAGGEPARSSGAEVPSLMAEGDVLEALQQLSTAQVAAAAPYLYIVARAQDVPVVVAGTWLDQAQKLEPTWKLEGNLVAARADDSRCLVGRNAARRLRLVPGSELELRYLDRSAQCSVAGIVDAGGAEDNQIIASLRAVQSLANLPGQIGLAQLSVTGTARVVTDYSARLAAALPQYQVRPIRQVSEAEGALLGRIRLLVVSMVLLILVLTALCVLATMAALALDRRKDVALMKSLGGSMARIVGVFLAEVGVLGAAGGLLGAIFGAALSYWMGLRVFGTAISPRWEVFPVTIALMIVVALAGALPLRMLGNVRPAEILRGE